MSCSDADLPDVSSKDTQTESSGDSAAVEGVEKTDQDKADKKENVKQWSIDRIKKEYRRFNIDLAPKVRFQIFVDAHILIFNVHTYIRYGSYCSYYSPVVN